MAEGVIEVSVNPDGAVHASVLGSNSLIAQSGGTGKADTVQRANTEGTVPFVMTTTVPVVVTGLRQLPSQRWSPQQSHH